MTAKRRPVLKYAGLGCLTLLLLILLMLVVSLSCIQIGGTRSISSRQQVDTLYDDATAFTPPVDGGFTHDRVQRMLTVRRTLQDYCPEFSEHARAFGRMNDYNDQEEIEARGEFVSDVGSALKSTVGFARGLNAYIILRNETLLAEQMGHGEYTWLFTMIYYSWLDHAPQPFMMANPDEPWPFAERIRPQVRAMFERWVAELNTHPTRSGNSELAALRLICQGELAGLQADPERLPFADGWPSMLTRELESYQAELEQAFCLATEELDLTRTEREGIGFEHK